jgi:hypothetical protein
MAFRIPLPLLLVLPFVLLIFITLRSPSPSHTSPHLHSTNPKVAQGRPGGALVNQASSGPQAAAGEPAIDVSIEDGILSTRIVAVGDIHGDLPRLMKVLRRAGVVDLKGYWIGGETILVQTGGSSFSLFSFALLFTFSL